MSNFVRGLMAGVGRVPAASNSSPSSRTCAPRVPTDNSVPGTLADWCQVNLANGEVAALASDVVFYNLNTPLYSDGAIKRRTVRLPPGTVATYSDAGVLGFPEGTVFTKSFGFRQDARDTTLPIHWVETRVQWKAAGNAKF